MAKFESKILAMKQVIFVKGANDAVMFYKAAFGAEEVKKAQEMKRPFVVSAEMKLAGYTLFISDGVGGSVFVLELETGDVELVVEQLFGKGLKWLMARAWGSSRIHMAISGLSPLLLLLSSNLWSFRDFTILSCNLRKNYVISYRKQSSIKQNMHWSILKKDIDKQMQPSKKKNI